jgi:hypothetical protein
MRAGLFLFGWALLGLAFLSLFGEMAARDPHEARGLYLSAEELWAALAPDSFAEFRARFRSAARPFWTYGLGPILKLPAWLLTGLPGLLAIVYARRFGRAADDIETEGFFLYEELVKRAKEEGHADTEEHPPEDGYEAIAASAREAEADLTRNPIIPSPQGDEEAKPVPAAGEDKPPPLNHLPS